MLVESQLDDMLPDWLTDNISHICSCGSPIMNYYNKDNECTNRVCSNPVCPEHTARKLMFCLKELGFKGNGIGVVKCKELARAHCTKSHFQAFPSLFDEKPKCTVAMYLKLCCIYGMDNRWNDVAAQYNTVDEFLSGYNGTYRNTVDDNLDLIEDNVGYVDFVSLEEFEYKPVVTGNIMITGDVKGFSDRKLFPYALRKATQGRVEINLVGKRKTDVMALIKEEASPTSDKVRVATENGIPIYTSEQFIKYVIGLMQERLGE